MPESKNNNDNLTQERRKFVRLNINVEINYSIIPHEEQQETGTKNISAGGICMVSDKPLSIGDTLQLEIKLPEDPPSIQVKGKAVWVKQFIATEKHESFDIGVEFINISEENRKRINKYVFSLK